MTKPKTIVSAVVLVLIATFAVYVFFSQKTNKDQPDSVTMVSETEIVGWPLYRDSEVGVEFQYPSEYDSDPHRDWVWTGDGGKGSEAHLVSKEREHIIHVIREPFDSNHCLHELCVVPIRSELSINDIDWEYLGIQGYCDVGECDDGRSVYRTTHNNARYYLLFEGEKRENEVLSSFSFLE